MTYATPVKQRELRNHHFDSTIWNDFAFRDDDIIISTYAKSGTTWTQQIIAQLIFDADPTVNTAELSPWLDLRVPPKAVKLPEVEAQTHRRFLKTHLPVDALVFSPKAKYVYIGRDGRDVLFSFYHHHKHANAAFFEALNDTPGRVGPPLPPAGDDISDYFDTWLDNNGEPWWPFWENVRSWWAIRELPNVYLLHFEDLKTDMPGEIRKLAAFLDIPVNEQKWADVLHHCSFDYMKQHGERAVPLGGAFWEGGASTFINKGVNGRWRNVLSDEQVRRYEATALRELGKDCAGWLAGSLPAAS